MNENILAAIKLLEKELEKIPVHITDVKGNYLFNKKHTVLSNLIMGLKNIKKDSNI